MSCKEIDIKGQPQIELDKVATNNLKSIDIKFPIGHISVVTGVSGSGKSSLVFDTLYGEAYRRYVESLSSFARQYLKALPKPAVATVRNLPPAIAVQQSRSGTNNRSTVGTMTELNDILRILFTHLAKIFCTNCGALVERDTAETITDKSMTTFTGARVMIAAPLLTWEKLPAKELKAQLTAQGFTRVYTDEGVTRLEDCTAANLRKAAVIVDRIQLSGENKLRFNEAAALALKVGRGHVLVIDEKGRKDGFSSALECARCGIDYEEPSTALLSFNHPLGACPGCQGFGYASELDWDKVFPSMESSLALKGVAPWNFGQFAEYYKWAKTSAKKVGVVWDKPFAEYSASDWTWLKEGGGRGEQFDGVNGFFAYLDSKKYKAHYRIHSARFRRYVLCPRCEGARLNDKALACRLLGLNMAEISDKSIDSVSGWLADLLSETQSAPRFSSGTAAEAGKADANGLMGITEALDEAAARLNYLRKIGVGYLSLSRSSRTLSGGELQRINMARCLGSALTDTLFCLDEPTAGLHARDSHNLLEVVRELRDQGNTVVLVEHERTMIDGADHLVEIGPKAGHEGGEVVYEGKPKPNRLVTGEVAGGAARLAGGLAEKAKFIELVGAQTHNLKNIDIKIPIGAMTAVCGVSGSGKTSLIQHTLYPLLAKCLGQAVDRNFATQPNAKLVRPTSLIKAHSEVMLVSQAALGRSSRSNIATYLGLMDEIRKLLASQPLAKQLKLSPGAFSFNTPGGRCETCRGLGTVVEDLSFLGEMAVTCPACNGRRFGDTVLQVEIRGRNLLDILGLTISQAREFFYDRSAIVKACDIILEMGMGYLTLGQHTSSFSGGEAQRLKLVGLMRDVKDARPAILIFDEPTTGLSDWDVGNLLAQFRALAAKGHTIIVVEHHLDVLRSADWLIEIGPEAAERGGELVYQGAPVGIGEAKRSLTAPYLWTDKTASAGR